MLKEFSAVVVTALIGGSFCSTAVAADAPSAKRMEQTLQVDILIVDSHDAIQKWVLSPPSKRRGDYGRSRTVSKGAKIYFPIIVAGFSPTEVERLHFTADLELVSPSGKVLLTMKKCCGANQFDPRTPGLVVLNPVIDMTSESDDPSGTYTVRATATDGSRSASASESFRLQASTDAKREAAQQGGTKITSAAGAKKRSRAREDARHCLDLATNVEIIRCAEKYR